MADNSNAFTSGKIITPLIKFAIPIFFAMLLQVMYGAIDLLVVGRFGESIDVSAVATGSQIMQSITTMIGSFAMGTTILIGHKIGAGKKKEGGDIVGTSICVFAIIGILLTIVMVFGARGIANIMNAPQDAFNLTVMYLRICGAGSLVIIAYNLIGSIFRGIGDSATPLITVAIAAVINIIGDVLLVAGFHLGTVGAACATVLAQGISVVISLLLIRRKELPFSFSIKQINMIGSIGKKITSLGAPIALQDILLSVSFLIITSLINNLGVTASAGVGVAQKVCGFIMLVPNSFAQAMSAFVAQNIGAGKFSRARKALWYAIGISTVIDIFMFYISFFHGTLLAGIFSNDSAVILACADYLRAYALDCLITCFLFCFIGFFNGLGRTKFVMMQGIVTAFVIRVPVAVFMSKIPGVSLFKIGLGIPLSTFAQIILFFTYYAILRSKGLFKEQPLED